MICCNLVFCKDVYHPLSLCDILNAFHQNIASSKPQKYSHITFKNCYIQDGGNIGGSGIHFPATPGKYLADLRSRANNQQYSSIYEDQRPKIEDIERSDGKKSAQGQ